MHLSWIVLIVCLSGCEQHPLDREPMCTSRFDFEDKLLDKVIRMEIMMEQIKNRVDGDLQKFEKYNDAFTLEFDNMRKEMSKTIIDLKTSYRKLEEKADVKLAEMGGILDTKVAEISQAITDLKASYGDLEEKADVKLTAMEVILDTKVAEMKQKIESSFKPEVVFHVKDINGQPVANSIIKFKTVVENINSVYDLDTGCFTAPLRGTYWFSAHMCANSGRYLYTLLYVQNTLVNTKYVNDKDTVACGTLFTVAVLNINDTACLKTGSVSTDPVWNYSNANSFMGGLIN